MMTEQIRGSIVRTLETTRPGRSVLRFYRRHRGRRDPRKPRVLCVGFQKTGTSSLGVALRRLGFSHYGYDPDFFAALQRGEIGRCVDFAAHFDSLDDLPWSHPTFIEAFRQRFPGARYVMLLRDEASWLRSYFNYFGPRLTREEALDRLRTHNARVESLLAGEPHVLRMRICGGEGYDTLCPFLGIEPLQAPFPWVNRTPT